MKMTLQTPISNKTGRNEIGLSVLDFCSKNHTFSVKDPLQQQCNRNTYDAHNCISGEIFVDLKKLSILCVYAFEKAAKDHLPWISFPLTLFNRTAGVIKEHIFYSCMHVHKTGSLICSSD